MTHLTYGLIAGALALTPAADAATTCGPHDRAVRNLSNKYGEAPIATGMVSPELVMEMFVNAETGSWTVIYTNLDGISCVVGAGTEFETLGSAPKGDPL
jgi:hypothetical protein